MYGNQSVNEIYEAYLKARNSVGIVNLSHLGKFLVSVLLPWRSSTIARPKTMKKHGLLYRLHEGKKIHSRSVGPPPEPLPLSRHRRRKRENHETLKTGAPEIPLLGHQRLHAGICFLYFPWEPGQRILPRSRLPLSLPGKRQNYAYFQLLAPKNTKTQSWSISAP